MRWGPGTGVKPVTCVHICRTDRTELMFCPVSASVRGGLDAFEGAKT